MKEQAAKNDFFRIIFNKTLFREDLTMLYLTFNQRFFSKRAPAGVFWLCRDKIRFIQGCGVVVFLGGVGFLTTLGQKNPTPDVQLDVLYHTPKSRIPVEIVQFFLKLLLKQISCCAPRFPLILTAKLYSLHVKESEILERSVSDDLPSTLQPRFHPSPLHIRVPD